MDDANTRSEKLLLTARESARMLSVSERTLWSLTNDGAIPAVRIGRRVLYSPEDLEGFIEANKTA